MLLQVLSIGETVEEVNDSGFLGPTPTLRCQLLADDSILQVRPHIRFALLRISNLHLPTPIPGPQHNHPACAHVCRNDWSSW